MKTASRNWNFSRISWKKEKEEEERKEEAAQDTLGMNLDKLGAYSSIAY
jgi:hypothetical protein